MKQLFLAVLFALLFSLDSCNKKEAEPEVQNPKPDAGFIANHYKARLINSPNSKIIAIAKDSIFGKTYIFSKSTPSGSNSKLANLTYFETPDVFVSADFSETTNLPISYTINSFQYKSSHQIKILNLDLTKNKVSYEVYDLKSKQKVVPLQEVDIPSTAATNLKYAKKLIESTNLNARVSGLTCQTVQKMMTVAKAAACFSLIVYNIATWEKFVIMPWRASQAFATTIQVCYEAKEGIEYWESVECSETAENLVPILDCLGQILGWNVLAPKTPECVQNLLDDLFPPDPNNDPGESWGDPHLISFDGLKYDFQAWGEFVAVKSTTDNFEIQVRQIGTIPGRISYNKGFAVQTGSDVVSWLPKGLYINKSIQKTDFKTLALKDGASLTIEKDVSGWDILKIRTRWNDIVTVRLTGMDYKIQLAAARAGKIVGLLGDKDGKKNNDLRLRSGELIEIDDLPADAFSMRVPFEKMYPVFADSWRIDQATSLFYYDGGDKTETFTNRKYPTEPVTISADDRAKAEAVCKSAGVGKEPYLSACIFDVASSGDPSLAAASLWMEKTQPRTDVVQVTAAKDIKIFNNIKVTMSELQGTLEDSCLINFSTGQVFQLKDGAKYADQVDGIFLEYCNLVLATPQSIITCGGSCGVARINNVITSQKWNTYRQGSVEFTAFPRDDDPTNPRLLAKSAWADILTSADIENSFKNMFNVLTTDSKTSSTNLVQGNGVCVPTEFMDKTMRRFLTQDGKKGIIKLNGWGKKDKGYWLSIDIKVQE